MIRPLAALMIAALLIPWPPAVIAAEAPLAARTVVTVLSYEKKTNTYKITPTKTPGEGDGTVTAEALANAIDTLELAKIKQDPLSLVGKTYTCTKPLELVAWEG